jgi:hypothetical protein
MWLETELEMGMVKELAREMGKELLLIWALG